MTSIPDDLDLPRRRSLGMRLFGSKDKTRKDSVDSLSSVSSNGSWRRRLRKGSTPNTLTPTSSTPSSSMTTVTTASTNTSIGTYNSRDIPTRNKLTKKQTNDFPTIDLSQAYERDKQTGEVIDHTDLLHSLVHTDSREDAPYQYKYVLRDNVDAVPGDAVVNCLPEKLWSNVLGDVSLADKVSLSCSCKAFRTQLRRYERELEDHDNVSERRDFLLRLDKNLPNHLFCFNCNLYHRRVQPGTEIIKPTNVANPILNCPYNNNPKTRPSRTRITSGRALSFPFLQLLLRAHHFSPLHGVSLDALSRRWKDRETDWVHQSRYAIVNDHLLMRVISTTFCPPALPPSGLRRLLYNPSDEFHPYFSTCPHWRDGDLMQVVKCAMSHIPPPITGGGVSRLNKEVQAHFRHESPIISLCQECRPMRRCPDCPTEYLVELKVVEDKTEMDLRKKFKQALVVTRWSDLGPGTAPDCPEWVACTGGVVGQPLDSRQMNGMGRREIISDADAGVWRKVAAALEESDHDDVEDEVETETTDSPIETHQQEIPRDNNDYTANDTKNNANTTTAVDETKVKRLEEESNQGEWTGSGFDSIAALGKRAISGVFESQYNVDLIPGQRILDLNPQRRRRGEAGNSWY